MFFSYDEIGQLKEKYVRNLPLKPEKLSWDMTDEILKKSLEDAYKKIYSIIEVCRKTFKYL